VGDNRELNFIRVFRGYLVFKAERAGMTVTRAKDLLSGERRNYTLPPWGTSESFKQEEKKRRKRREATEMNGVPSVTCGGQGREAGDWGRSLDHRKTNSTRESGGRPDERVRER